MGVDLSKVAASAIEAALDDGEKKPKHGSAVKAVAAGAALAVVAKAATSKKSKLLTKLVPTPSLDGLRDIPDRVRDRLADAGWLGDEDDVVDDEPSAEELLDEEDEPVDEEDEDFDDEDDVDEDAFDEDEDEEPAPELALDSDDDQDIDPAERPPKPPKATSRR
jgi:hypothetical protein